MSNVSFPARKDFGAANNIGMNLNDAVTIENLGGYSSIGFHCNVPLGGEVTFEASYNGVDWDAVSMRSVNDDVFQKTTVNGSDFIGSIGAACMFRFRTSIAGSANGTVIGRMQRGVSMLEGIEFGYPPHRFGFLPVHKDASFTSAQTDTPIWTPVIGKKFIITDIGIICGGTTDSRVTIFDDTNVSGKILFNGLIDVIVNKQYSYNHSFITPFIGDAIDSVLKLTTSAAITIDINLHGYEV